jgi:hypothetical protein
LFNLKQKLKAKPIVTADEFEKLTGLNALLYFSLVANAIAFILN